MRTRPLVTACAPTGSRSATAFRSASTDMSDNTGFPIAWRVDSELGVGPSRQILQNWRLTEGESEVTRYRLIVYTGQLDPTVLHRAWTAYAGGPR